MPLIAALAVMGSVFAFATPSSATSADQIAGLGVPWPLAPETCDPAQFGPVDYIIAMPAGNGDLVGCVYGFREPAEQMPGGTISQLTHEIFAGCLGDRCGTFEMQAHITSKWDGRPGPPPADKIFGRCQHKVIAGTGTGDFVGVTGRIDYKDTILRDADGVVTGVEFVYRGHLK